jgi:hypothetical protein
MFPTDTITARYEITGTGSVVLASSTRSILNVGFQKATLAKDLYLKCDNNVIASLYSAEYIYNFPLQYVCNGTITFSSIGSGTNLNSILISYVNRDITTSINPNSGSTTPFYTNGFSYGDIISIMLLLFIFTLLFFKTLKEWIFGTKIDGASAIKIEKYHNI